MSAEIHGNFFLKNSNVGPMCNLRHRPAPELMSASTLNRDNVFNDKGPGSWQDQGNPAGQSQWQGRICSIVIQLLPWHW